MVSVQNCPERNQPHPHGHSLDEKEHYQFKVFRPPDRRQHRHSPHGLGKNSSFALTRPVRDFMLLRMKPWLVLVLVGGLLTSAMAHDPYEIASVVYIQSNRIEVFLEMEFPTGIRLAGLEPSLQTSAESQFAAAVPRLEQFAGGLFEISAGNQVLLPLRTNVELGVETHIRGQLEMALTDSRPLRFDPRGLRVVQGAPYGVSLTVLDMVNKKVIGQAALFADSLPADFPATDSTLNSTVGSTLVAAKTGEPVTATVTTNSPSAGVGGEKSGRPGWLATMVVLSGIAILLVAWRRSPAP